MEDNPVEVTLDFAGDSVNVNQFDASITTADMREVTKAVRAEMARSGLGEGIGRPGVGVPGGITDETRQSALEGTLATIELFFVEDSVNATPLWPGLMGQASGLVIERAGSGY